jgi:hypothetical protein
MRCDIWKDGTKIAAGLTASQAARNLGILTDDLRWAIEEHGRCDDDQDRTVVPAGSPDPGPLTEAMLEDYAAG